MSADPFKSIGRANIGGLQRTQPSNPVTAPKEVGGAKEASAFAPQEAFSPTAEASETPEDQKAGEAKASQILGSWNQPSQAGPVSSSLSIQGAKEVNQVHGTANGQIVSSPPAQPGFSEATVYSTKPPTA